VADNVTTAAIDWLTPASRVPWPVAAPFRMRPNLEKLDPVAPALLLHDELADVYRRERELVVATHAERAMVGTANDSVLTVIHELAPSMKEDFVILKQDGDSLRTEYLSVCLFSR